MSIGDIVQRAHDDTMGTVKAIDGVHVQVLWAGQKQAYWTVEWQLRVVRRAQTESEVVV